MLTQETIREINEAVDRARQIIERLRADSAWVGPYIERLQAAINATR